MTESMKKIWWEYWKCMKHPRMFTKRRLAIIEETIFQDRYFWEDVARHGADKKPPEELLESNRHGFDHCIGNMTGMICDRMYLKGILK